MLEWALFITFALMATAMACAFFRLLIGPHALDRVVALDTLYVNVVAFIVLLGIYNGTTLFFEAALLIAMMGFVGTVVLAKFFMRGSIIE